MSQPISVSLEMDLAWSYASGEAMERFCSGLREGRIEALRCAVCGLRYLPPRPVCGDCRVRLTEWVAVRDEGLLEAWTEVHVPMLDAGTGRRRAVPFAIGLVRLDGADTTLNHFLAETGASRLRIGARVRARWRGERTGTMADIECFEVIG